MRTRYSWYPVRCCCQPRKLLGFLRLPEDNLRSVAASDGTWHPIELKMMCDYKPISSMESLREVPISDIAPTYTEELAVYSEDRPIEFWRGVPDFIEAPEIYPADD